jgi:hypothetical protein
MRWREKSSLKDKRKTYRFLNVRTVYDTRQMYYGHGTKHDAKENKPKLLSTYLWWQNELLKIIWQYSLQHAEQN